MKIIQVKREQADLVTSLFDGYMQFYEQVSNPEKYGLFISERLRKNEAVIFLALSEDGAGMGFTLLYPSFSSVSQGPVYVLNDLFVDPNYRKQGVASQLMDRAINFAKSKGAVRLHLETGITNENAQSLYEKEGWVKESDTYHYNFSLK